MQQKAEVKLLSPTFYDHSIFFRLTVMIQKTVNFGIDYNRLRSKKIR